MPLKMNNYASNQLDTLLSYEVGIFSYSFTCHFTILRSHNNYDKGGLKDLLILAY